MSKTYINGPLINEHVFDDGGSILKLSIAADKIDELAAQLKSAADEGWVRLVIQKNKSPMLSKKTGKVVSTHSISVDTWKPTPRTGSPAARPYTPAPRQAAPAPRQAAAAHDDNEVPF